MGTAFLRLYLRRKENTTFCLSAMSYRRLAACEKVGRRLGHRTQCWVYLRIADGALVVCKTANANPAKSGKLFVHLDFVGRITDSVSAAAAAASSSSTSSSAFNHVVKLIPSPHAPSSMVARSLAFRHARDVYAFYDALRSARTFPPGVIGAQSKPSLQQRAPPQQHLNYSHTSAGAPPSAGGGQTARGHDDDGRPRRQITQSLFNTFVDDAEDDAVDDLPELRNGKGKLAEARPAAAEVAASATTSATASASAAAAAAAAASVEVGAVAATPSTSPDAGGGEAEWRDMFARCPRTPRHKRLHQMLVAPSQSPPMTDLLVYETRRWIYIFGRSDPDIISGGAGGAQSAAGAPSAPETTATAAAYSSAASSSASSSPSSSSSSSSSKYNLVKISRRDDLHDEGGEQSLADIMVFDPHRYDPPEIKALLQTLEVIARGENDELVGPTTAVAIVGFVRFLRGFYLILATERTLLGHIAGHPVYGVAASQVIQCWRPVEEPVSHSIFGKLRQGIAKQFSSKSPVDAAEAKYLALFSLVDLTKDFFFSYTYALTHTVQTNLEAARAAMVGPPTTATTTSTTTAASTTTSPSTSSSTTTSSPCELRANDRFVWNRHLTSDFLRISTTGADIDDNAQRWCVTLLHGSFSQRECSVFGKRINLTLIARRSRHFAGTRYLKRGVTEDGKVANDVEIEQIVESVDSGRLTSHVQVRGSIPVFWTQETSATNPKPPIVIQRRDPTFEAAKRHFCDLFERYAEPVVVLDLVRSAENEGPRNRRESLVGDLFRMAVGELNTQLPAELGIRYKPLDFKAMSKHSDSKRRFVFDALFALAEESLQLHGFCAFAPAQRLPGDSAAWRDSDPLRFSPSSSSSLSASSTLSSATVDEDAMRFHFGPCSTTNSELLLNGRRVGTFMLREDNGGVQVLSYMTAEHQVKHVPLFRHPRTGMYRLPHSHWVGSLTEAIHSFGATHENELRAGLRYEGQTHMAKEEDLDGRSYGVRAVSSGLKPVKRTVSELTSLARNLQQPGISSQIIRDRRYRMRVYKRCFVASELIDVMLEREYVMDRSSGVAMGLALQQNGHLHHVVDHHAFRDGRYFFRWYNDEAALLMGTHTMHHGSSMVAMGAGQRNEEGTEDQEGIFTRLEIDFPGLAELMRAGLVVEDRVYRGQMNRQCFVGRDAVDWLVGWIRAQNSSSRGDGAGSGGVKTTGGDVSHTRLRNEAVALGRAMVTAGLICHVSETHTFKDGALLYHFTKNRAARTHTQHSRMASIRSLGARRYAAGRGGLIKQRGVVRSNCIDCLDRTNVAQWCIGMRVLACQLYVLGVDLCLQRPNGMSAGGHTASSASFSFTSRSSTSELVLTPKSKVTQVITQMWEALGDRIALQYGGSEAHKKVTGQTVSSGDETGRKRKGKKTSEVLTSIRRYYSNSFTDRTKQDAMNLFLGMFQPMRIRQELDTLEREMESRTYKDRAEMEAMRREKMKRGRSMRSKSRSGSIVGKGKRGDDFFPPTTYSGGPRLFHFQHLWELESESLPADYYLHNRQTMEGYRRGALGSILSMLMEEQRVLDNGGGSGGSMDEGIMVVNRGGDDGPGTVPGSMAKPEGRTLSQTVTTPTKMPPGKVKMKRHIAQLKRSRRDSGPAAMDNDWWTNPLKRFVTKAEDSLVRVGDELDNNLGDETASDNDSVAIAAANQPAASVRRSGGISVNSKALQLMGTKHCERVNVPKQSSTLTMFDALVISSGSLPGMPRLLELEADIVGHRGSLESSKVRKYEQQRMTPQSCGLPVNATEALQDIHAKYTIGIERDSRAVDRYGGLGLYYHGEVEKSSDRNNDLCAESVFVWLGKKALRAARTGAGEQQIRFHLLQQWWGHPQFISTGLAVAPQKEFSDDEEDKNMSDAAALEGTTGVGGGGSLPAGRQSPAKRSSVFKVMDSLFGIGETKSAPQQLGAIVEEGEERAAGAATAGTGSTSGAAAPRTRRRQPRRGGGAKSNVNLRNKLHPELPLQATDVLSYQEYVELGHNAWHGMGMRAEEALFEEVRAGESGMPHKRELEMFRHLAYLQADPYDLEAMRAVQRAGGATMMISHGAFRGLRQDVAAVDTKASLESLVWGFSSSDAELFRQTVGGTERGLMAERKEEAQPQLPPRR